MTGVGVGVLEQGADRGGVTEVAEHEEPGVEVGGEQFGSGAAVRRQRGRELVRDGLAEEGAAAVAGEIVGIDGPRAGHPGLLADLLDHQRPRQGERILRHAHAEHDGAATTAEIHGIHQCHGCPCATGEQLLGCGNYL